MKSLYKKKKFVPTFYGFDDCLNEKFYCYYEEGIYDKYGLRYTTENTTEKAQKVHFKGKKYGKQPISFDTYEEMMEKTEKLARSISAAHKVGDIRRQAVYLILDLDKDGNLVSVPFDFMGYVSKRNTVFNITGDGTKNGVKRFALTPEDKKMVFPDIAKAARYVEENYGRWAASHYLKSHVFYSS